MKSVILYGSKYGSTRRYAEKLSAQAGMPAVCYKKAPDLSGVHTIVYLGGIYAGGVLGLSNTLRGFSLQDTQRFILVTVGLADPTQPENKENIRTALRKQLSSELFARAEIFHLRGGIDYQKLSLPHRVMMKLLHQSLSRIPAEKQTAENRALMETYGRQVDFTDFDALAPIVRTLER